MQCTAISCPPPTVANGLITTPSDYTMGAVAKVSCEAGFRLDGADGLVCAEDATWHVAGNGN